ncbi:MAG: DNA polymerase IV [Candidatus Nanopelagicales bacterium]
MTSRQLDRGSAPQDWGTDDMGCNILHVDMDAFFASVEVRDRPDLRGLPVVVGRGEGRGVVLSATYEARARGVHSAMPVGMARRACPEAIFVEPTRGKYTAASEAVMAILRQMTPTVEVLSVDEAFLDVRSVRSAVGSPTQIGVQIRRRMEEELGLTCSVGISSVTMAAKAASTTSKPNGLLVVPAEATVRFLHHLQIGQLWGVGEKTEKQLRSLGVVTVGDLAAISQRRLGHTIGKAASARLLQLASGQEVRPVNQSRADKSISSERTFDSDIESDLVIERELRNQSHELARRLRASDLVARVVAVKLRYDDFSTVGRSHTLAASTDVAAEIFAAVRPMWAALREVGRPVRLVGVRVERLQDSDQAGRQLSFDDRQEAQVMTEGLAEMVSAKFGKNAVQSARMLETHDPDR